MGFPKALLPYAGSTFLEHLAGVLAAGNLDPILVVLGHDADRIREGVSLPPEARIVVNQDYKQGQLSSLKAALRVLEPSDVEGIVLAPVDHPCFQTETLERLLGVFADQHPPVVIPTWNGRRGHPVVFSAALFPELLAAPVDQGARPVVRRHAAVEVAVNDGGVLADIDDPDLYRQFIGREVPRP